MDLFRGLGNFFKFQSVKKLFLVLHSINVLNLNKNQNITVLRFQRQLFGAISQHIKKLTKLGIHCDYINICSYRNSGLPIKTIVIEIKHKYNNKYSLWAEILQCLYNIVQKFF